MTQSLQEHEDQLILYERRLAHFLSPQPSTSTCTRLDNCRPTCLPAIPPLTTLVQDEHGLILPCLDITATAHHLCPHLYKMSMFSSCLVLMSLPLPITSVCACTRRVQGCLPLVIAPPPTALIQNKCDLISCFTTVSHPATVAAIVHLFCLRSYKTSAGLSCLATTIYHHLCLHSSKMSAGSSFHTVSAHAHTKQA